MKTGIISDLFEDGGLKTTASNEKNIHDLQINKIVELFEKYGVILFRGFNLSPQEITNFTDLFTEKYAKDAYRRKKRFENNKIHDVDIGNDAHTLHSEGSYSPACPEIIWFLCNIPPDNGGETILCDGVKLWKALSSETKAYFLAQPLRFDVEIPIDVKRKGKDKHIWISNKPGTSGYFDWKKGKLIFTQFQYAIQPTRFGNSLAFSNHLLAELGKDPQIINKAMLMSSGEKVPQKLIDEITKKSEELTYEHNWIKSDLIMLDNRRFMHGRRAFEKHIKRDIVIMQTERASFGYGATIRKQINSNKRQLKSSTI